MTLSDVLTNDYAREERPVEPSGESISFWQLPKLLWAASALLIINLTVGMGLWLNPELKPDVYGKEVANTETAVSKPSPFAQTIDLSKPKVRAALKLRPVAFTPDPLAQPADAASATAVSAGPSDVQGRTQPATYRPDDQLKVYSSESAELNLRRASEREKFVTLN